MAIKERGEVQVYYKWVGKILASAKEMGPEEKNLIFTTAVKHASHLVEQKVGTSRDLIRIGEQARAHLNVIVLDRIVSQYQPGSTPLFNDLKKTISETFLIKNNSLSDERLCNLLSTSLDDYFFIEMEDDVSRNMGTIRSIVDYIVPSKIDI